MSNAIIVEQQPQPGRPMRREDRAPAERSAGTAGESEEKLQTIFRESPDVIVVIDAASGEILTVNWTARRRLGYEPGDLIGRHFSVLFPHHLDVSPISVLELVRLHGGICEEQNLLRIDGSQCPMDLTATFTSWAGHEAVIATLRDVSERRRAQAALREVYQLNEQIIANAGQGIFLLDRELRVQVWNRFLEQLTDLRAADVVGKFPGDLFPEYRVPETEAFLQRALAGERVTSPDLFFRMPRTGRSGWFTCTGAPRLDGRGAVAGVIGIVTEITGRRQVEKDLRQAEEKYRSIFEHAVEGIFQTTAEGRYLNANPALAAMYGYDSPADLITHLTDIAHDLYVDPARRDTFNRLMAADGIVQNFESEIRRKDGHTLWITENARAVCDTDGQLGYYEGTVTDITARKQAEAANARLIHELEQANRLKSEFVATMSHELRTPLNIIMGYAEALLHGELGRLADEQDDAIARIQRHAHVLHELINTTLDLSRLAAGRLRVDWAWTRLADLVGELAEEMHELREKPGVAFSWTVPADLPRILTDPAKLKVVLKNLIGNAMKFTERGHVTVSASHADDQVAMIVEDSGIGIPAELLGVIFEPFRQGDGSDTRRYGGVGLGLHVVRRLLDLLGGSVSVESTVGAGTTFTVRLPVEGKGS